MKTKSLFKTALILGATILWGFTTAEACGKRVSTCTKYSTCCKKKSSCVKKSGCCKKKTSCGKKSSCGKNSSCCKNSSCGKKSSCCGKYITSSTVIINNPCTSYSRAKNLSDSLVDNPTASNNGRIGVGNLRRVKDEDKQDK